MKDCQKRELHARCKDLLLRVDDLRCGGYVVYAAVRSETMGRAMKEFLQRTPAFIRLMPRSARFPY